MSLKGTQLGKALVGVALTALAACAGSARLQTYPASRTLPEVKAVVLLPPEIFFRGMKAYQVFEKWIDLADALTARSGVVVVGPDEFNVITSQAVTDLAHETNIPAVLGKFGIDSDNALALKLTLTEAWQEGSCEISSEHGAKMVGTPYESEFMLSAEVYHVSTTAPVLTFSDSLRLTTWDSPSAADPRPDITRFSRECYNRILNALASLPGFPPPPPAPAADRPRLVTAQSPREALRFAYRDLKPLIDLFHGMDEMDRDATLNARIEYRNPHLPRPVARALMELPAGVYIISAHIPELLPGDIVVQSNRGPINRDYQLVRALRTAPIRLEVLRNNTRVYVEINR